MEPRQQIRSHHWHAAKGQLCCHPRDRFFSISSFQGHKWNLFQIYRQSRNIDLDGDLDARACVFVRVVLVEVKNRASRLDNRVAPRAGGPHLAESITLETRTYFSILGCPMFRGFRNVGPRSKDKSFRRTDAAVTVVGPASRTPRDAGHPAALRSKYFYPTMDQATKMGERLYGED